MEAIRTELTLLIVTNDVFEPIISMMYLVLKGRTRFSITKYKARSVMDGCRAQIGVDVFDYALIRTHQLLITRPFDY